MGPHQFLVEYGVEFDHCDIAEVGEIAIDVQHVGHPPLIPAAKLRPTLPSTMMPAGHAFGERRSPVPSTTHFALRPQLQKCSPAILPRMNASPPVAP